MEAAFDILFDGDFYNYVRSLQVKLYQKYKTKEAITLEPHITLKYAFPVVALASIEKYFDELVNFTQTFEIETNGINSFPSRVIFLDIVANQLLRSLHLKILEEVNSKFAISPTEFEGSNFHFHSTLAYKDISEDTFEKIKEYLKE